MDAFEVPKVPVSLTFDKERGTSAALNECGEPTS